MKTSWVLSLISFFLALAATMLGLFQYDLYQDNAFVRTAWKANWFWLLIPSLFAGRKPAMTLYFLFTLL